MSVSSCGVFRLCDLLEKIYESAVSGYELTTGPPFYEAPDFDADLRDLLLDRYGEVELRRRHFADLPSMVAFVRSNPDTKRDIAEAVGLIAESFGQATGDRFKSSWRNYTKHFAILAREYARIGSVADEVDVAIQIDDPYTRELAGVACDGPPTRSAKRLRGGLELAMCATTRLFTAFVDEIYQTVHRAVPGLAQSRGHHQPEHSTDDESTSADQPPCVVVDIERQIAICNGQGFDIGSKQAARWLKLLTNRPGEWLSSSDLGKLDPELDGAYPHKLRAHIPLELLAFIESKRGTGSRLLPSHRAGTSP